jgi:hypothetical protein
MLYAYHFHSDGSDTAPGSTTLGVSTAVLRALTRTGAGAQQKGAKEYSPSRPRRSFVPYSP